MDNRTYIIYLITRDDGLRYVGTTDTKRLYHRMKHHAWSERFKHHSFEWELLAWSEYQNIHKLERYYIHLYDTFKSGLNCSIDGKGNHLAPNFTTRGYSHKEETKKKIGEKSKKARKARGYKHKEATREHWSKIRKGKVHSRKFSLEIIRSVLEMFEKRPHIPEAGTKSRNGRVLPYERAFSNKYAGSFGMTAAHVYNIITNKIIL
jgi:hypothetical protein